MRKNKKIKGFTYSRRRKIKKNRRKQKRYSDNIGTVLFYIFLLPLIGIYHLIVDSFKSNKRKQKSKIIKPETDLYEVNEAESTVLTSTSTVSSITLQWNKKLQADIYKDGKQLAELTRDTVYTDEPLYADSEHTYKVILTDRHNNKSEKMCTAKTLDDGVCFRGLSPEAFDSTVNTSYKGSGVVTWSGNLINKEVEIKYRHIGTTGLTKTYIYFKNDKNENVHYKKNQNYVTSSGTNNMQKIRVKIPQGVTKIVFNGSDTEVIDVTVVNK